MGRCIAVIQRTCYFLVCASTRIVKYVLQFEKVQSTETGDLGNQNQVPSKQKKLPRDERDPIRRRRRIQRSRIPG